MKPKELIIDSLEKTLNETLKNQGFKFLKSLTYKRKIGEFTQTIQIQCNRYNLTNEIVSFWISDVSTSSKEYKKWKLDKLKEVSSDHVYGKASWNIPNWKKDFHRFDIAESSKRKETLSELKFNVINVLIPFLDKCSTWTGIAENAIETSHYIPHSNAVNFLYLSNQKTKSLELINKIENYLKYHPERVDRESEFERLNIKREMLFNNK